MSDAAWEVPTDPKEIRRELERISEQGCEHCDSRVTDRGPDGEDEGHWWLCGACANRQSFKITYLCDLLYRIWKDGLTPVLKEAHDAALLASDQHAKAVAEWGREVLLADRAKAQARVAGQ